MWGKEPLMSRVGNLDEDFIKKLLNSWIERGKKEGREEVALEMLRAGFSTDVIMKMTHLDEDKIEALRQKFN